MLRVIVMNEEPWMTEMKCRNQYISEESLTSDYGLVFWETGSHWNTIDVA